MPKVGALLLIVLVALVACGGPASSPTPGAPAIGPAATPGPPEPTTVPGATTAAEAGVLVRFETRGGECPNGPCGMQAVIRADGTIERSDGISSQVDPALLARLVAGIEQADWDAIRSVPFTGECPVNVDGQEQIYTFSAKGEAVEIATCATQIDPASEPFVTVQVILFGPGG